MSIAEQLAAPFDDVKTREGRGGMTFSYITARQVMNRLDEVVGWDRWETRFVSVNGETVCSLTIVTDDGRHITKSDGAGETGIEGEKGQFSDAFKRAAVHFGIGRYLYQDGLPKTFLEGSSEAVEQVEFDKQHVMDSGNIIKDCIESEEYDRVWEVYDALNESERRWLFAGAPNRHKEDGSNLLESKQKSKIREIGNNMRETGNAWGHELTDEQRAHMASMAKEFGGTIE